MPDESSAEDRYVTAYVLLLSSERDAVEMAQPSSALDTEVLHQLERRDTENRCLKHQIQQHEVQIEDLQRRESELGANYNALLQEYEHVCQYLSDSDEKSGQETDHSDPSSSEESPANPELSDVIVSMDALQSHLGEGFSSTSPQTSLDHPRERSEALHAPPPVSKQTDQIYGEVAKLVTGTQDIDSMVKTNVAEMQRCLSEATRDHQTIGSTVQTLKVRLSCLLSSNACDAHPSPVSLRNRCVFSPVRLSRKRGSNPRETGFVLSCSLRP